MLQANMNTLFCFKLCDLVVGLGELGVEPGNLLFLLDQLLRQLPNLGVSNLGDVLDELNGEHGVLSLNCLGAVVVDGGVVSCSLTLFLVVPNCEVRVTVGLRLGYRLGYVRN